MLGRLREGARGCMVLQVLGLPWGVGLQSLQIPSQRACSLLLCS